MGAAVGVFALVLCLPDGLELLSAGRTGRGQIAELPTVHQHTQALEHGRDIFVSHGAKHGVGGRVKTHGIEVFAQGGSGMGVVRNVQHQRGLAGHDLKAPRQLDHRQAIAHGLGGDG